MHAISICKTIGHAIAMAFGAGRPAATQAVETPEQAANNDLFMNYYRDPRPERLVGFLERYAKNANWMAFPPAVGLFAVVFREHPGWTERLIPSDLDATHAVAIGAALQLSGSSPVRRSGPWRLVEPSSTARLKAELANLPSQITEIRIATPTHLDIAWGAFFASGDERYVRMIIDFLARTANRSESITLDVLETTIAMSGGPKEIYRQLRGKYGDVLGSEIIVAATAGWALRANALSHERVANAMTAYISEHPATFATKLLSVIRPRPGASRP
jgi:hypothetical protein